MNSVVSARTASIEPPPVCRCHGFIQLLATDVGPRHGTVYWVRYVEQLREPREGIFVENCDHLQNRTLRLGDEYFAVYPISRFEVNVVYELRRAQLIFIDEKRFCYVIDDQSYSKTSHDAMSRPLSVLPVLRELSFKRNVTSYPPSDGNAYLVSRVRIRKQPKQQDMWDVVESDTSTFPVRVVFNRNNCPDKTNLLVSNAVRDWDGSLVVKEYSTVYSPSVANEESVVLQLSTVLPSRLEFVNHWPSRQCLFVAAVIFLPTNLQQGAHTERSAYVLRGVRTIGVCGCPDEWFSQGYGLYVLNMDACMTATIHCPLSFDDLHRTNVYNDVMCELLRPPVIQEASDGLSLRHKACVDDVVGVVFCCPECLASHGWGLSSGRKRGRVCLSKFASLVDANWNCVFGRLPCLRSFCSLPDTHFHEGSQDAPSQQVSQSDFCVHLGLSLGTKKILIPLGELTTDVAIVLRLSSSFPSRVDLICQ
jgi:hypothetical protein